MDLWRAWDRSLNAVWWLKLLFVLLFDSQHVNLIIFIRPRIDHCLALSLTHLLTLFTRFFLIFSLKKYLSYLHEYLIQP